MTDAVSEGEEPEDSQPKPLIEKARDFAKKHKRKIAIGTTIAAAGAAVLWSALEQRAEALANAEEYEDASQDAANPQHEASRQNSAPDKPPRNSPVEHDVQEHDRTLPDGRIIKISRHRRGGAKDEETHPSNEGPGEAAA
ncbi:hypothetical protein ACFYOG_36335 [Streptomyces sp. NPDC007818]|uniref:hypothetical protein n=1 Tax=Streptomyces sp. NPDC007818 TaxID=3364780 RepID=UPI0036C67E77